MKKLIYADEKRFADPTLDCDAIVNTIRNPELQETPQVPLAGVYRVGGWNHEVGCTHSAPLQPERGARPP